MGDWATITLTLDPEHDEGAKRVTTSDRLRSLPWHPTIMPGEVTTSDRLWSGIMPGERAGWPNSVDVPGVEGKDASGTLTGWLGDSIKRVIGWQSVNLDPAATSNPARDTLSGEGVPANRSGGLFECRPDSWFCFGRDPKTGAWQWGAPQNDPGADGPPPGPFELLGKGTGEFLGKATEGATGPLFLIAIIAVAAVVLMFGMRRVA